MKWDYLIVFIALFINEIAFSQSADSLFSIGIKTSIHSAILEEDRPLFIYTPHEYGEKEKTYPVLYLLDGGSNFHHTTATINFLERNGRIPEMIVVGIPNTTDRTRDLTPPSETNSDQFPTNGGADSLLAFMRNELFPFVEKKYRTADYKILVGHSFGGLFAIHALLHYPDMFHAHLAISPSFWWDNQQMVLNQIEDFLDNQKERKGHLYVTMGNEGTTMVGGMWKLMAALEEHNFRNLKWEFNRMGEESHGSIPLRSTYYGLEFIFKEWRFENWKEHIEMGGKSAFDHYIKQVQEYYNIPPDLNEGMLRNMSQSSIEAGNMEKAGGILAIMVEQFPDSGDAHSKYGAFLANQGEKNKAIQHLKKALEIQPSDSQAKASLLKLGALSSEDQYQHSVKQLNSFAGSYLAPNGMKLKITTDENTLWIVGDSTPKVEMISMSEGRFFIDMMNAEAIFTWQNEKVTGFTANINGQPFSVKKVGGSE